MNCSLSSLPSSGFEQQIEQRSIVSFAVLPPPLAGTPRTSLPLVLPFLLPQVFPGCSWISRVIYPWEGTFLRFLNHHCSVSGHWHFSLQCHELSNTRQHYSLNFQLCVTKLKNLNPCLDAWVRRQMSRAGMLPHTTMKFATLHYSLCSREGFPILLFLCKRWKIVHGLAAWN